MISYFLEELPKTLLPEDKNYHVVALTPLACYQLDKIGVSYSIPDDFVFPNEVSLETFKEVLDECKMSPSFSVLYGNIIRATVYWKKFVSIYVKAIKPERIVYIGESMKYLLQVLLEKSDEHKKPN